MVALLTIHTIEPRAFCLFFKLPHLFHVWVESHRSFILNGAYLDIKEIYGILKEQEIKWIFQITKARKSIGSHTSNALFFVKRYLTFWCWDNYFFLLEFSKYSTNIKISPTCNGARKYKVNISTKTSPPNEASCLL